MEVYANNASTTVGGSGYTAGSGILNVASTALPFPQITAGQQFHVSVLNGTTVVVILKVTAINSLTQWAVVAEGTDTNATTGNTVILSLTAGAFNQTRADAQGYGTYANLPTAGSQIGDYYRASDVPFDFHWNGASWDATERCSLLSEAVSSYGQLNATSQKAVTWAGSGGISTLLNYSGGQPGYLSSLWIAINSNSSDTDKATIQVYIDGSASPSINVHLTSFFNKHLAYNSNIPATAFGKYFSTPAQVAFEFRVPIPFTTGIKITITNVGATTYTAALWTNAYYVLGVPNLWKRTRKLFAVEGYTQNVTPFAVINLINVTGTAPGRFLGLSFTVDDNGSVSPDFGWAEGPISMTCDGTLVMASSGVEDYFGFTGYWQGVPIPTYNTYNGMIYRSASVVYNTYRLHILDPVTFNNAFLLTFTAGISSVVNWTGTGLLTYCAFYYTE